jgi:hypothetical protein
MTVIPFETRRDGAPYLSVAIPTKFSVWKTITLGTHKTVIELAEAIRATDCWIIDSALDLMAQPTFTLAPEATQVDLVAVSVGELGFTSGTPCGWIYERARQLGLWFCPPEVGPQLLLQHRGELDELVLWIAMMPIAGSGDRAGAFAITDGENENRWLLWYSGNPVAVCPPDFRFVFVLPRQFGLGRRALTVLRHLRLGGLRH